MTLIKFLPNKLLLILSTHIISDIESIAKETIMIKNGEIIMRGSHREILSNMNGKVYTIRVNDESQLEEIRRKYKVVNLQHGMDFTELRIVSDEVINDENAKVAEAKFEDVYMFYFDLENTKEV
ncbi:hypothetical protein L0P54_02475 [Anaerosalibacter bizertensis]|nr:hypothetical protein [Bacteroidales bacterium MSK.15.36]MCG4581839.1 hypothetical protein [Anaerosalibacter bizertensis]MCG4584967.1 hypothetical protein [Anaerosalibacter bizertensis]